MFTSNRSILLLSFAAALAALSTPAFADPTLTQAQAIQIASAFCGTVGALVTGPGVAVFPAPSSASGLPDTYYLPRWQVKFGHKAVLEVVDATGLVSRYYNYDLSHTAMQNNGPAGTPISQAVAIQKANSVLQAAGGVPELGTPQAQQIQITNPATSAGDLWMISLPRQFNTIPYRRQAASIVLQAETGNVQGLSITFETPAPAVATLTVTQDAGTAAAQAQLTASAITDATFSSAQQEVIQPNTFWQAGGSPLPQPGAAPRVAWTCFYTNATGDGIYEVWVDAITDGVIGGETIQQQGGHRRPYGRPKPPAGRKP